jgi:hypothetical protein
VKNAYLVDREKFEFTIVVIRSRKYKDKQYNGQKKKRSMEK